MTREEALAYIIGAVREMQERARADGFEDPLIDEALEVLTGKE